MTNVPDNLREMWADLYRLFDLNYNIKNDAESWKKFWEQVEQLNDKHKNRHFMALAIIVSDMIEDHILNKKYFPSTLEDMTLF